MLIRSQDKTTLIDIQGKAVRLEETFPGMHEVFISTIGTAWTVGTYSSAEKAMKVVNMIQEAYASYKGIRTILTGITTNSEIVIAVANDKGKMDAITETLKEAAIFQMPQDSEVV